LDIKNSKHKIIYFGSSEFSIEPLRRLKERFGAVTLVTAPPKRKGRGLVMKKNIVHEEGERKEIERILTPDNLLEKEFIEELTKISPDFIVLASYGKIIPSEVLRIPRIAPLNIHPSILPKYRGAAPIQRALMNGEKKTGVSVIVMTEKVDAGDILAQEEEDISLEDNYITLSQRLSKKGAELIIKVIEDYHKIKPLKQEEHKATYAKKIKKEERNINWEEDACSVHNLVRALYGYMPAITFFRNKRVEILETYPWAQLTGVPGEIISKEGKMLVICGKGGVEVLKLKVEAKREIKGIDFLNGYRPKSGEKFERRCI